MSDPIPVTLRPARAIDEAFLLEMCFYASHSHDEPGVTPEDLRTHEKLSRYVVGFGAPDDVGVVAESASVPIGAAWVRLLVGDRRGYSWVDDSTPELAIAVAPEFLGRGVGSRMLRAVLDEARGRFPAVCLGVRTSNPARRLYRRFGFEPVASIPNRVGGTSEIMVFRF
jgi:ribosomal protein S18 acetylase RimI-like enzyme